MKSLQIWILLFTQKNPHFSYAAFSPFILLPFLQKLKTIKKKKNGQINSFSKMINETCVPNPDPEIHIITDQMDPDLDQEHMLHVKFSQ
jgi:hypothetical protein